MIKTAVILFATTVGMVVVARSLAAQTSAGEPSPVIQTESREVEVDVTVTGRKGISTDGLTADYFSIKEDGKAQKVNSVQSAHPGTSLKHIVLYFDFYTSEILTAHQHALEKAAEGFIDSVAGPDRYMEGISGVFRIVEERRLRFRPARPSAKGIGGVRPAKVIQTIGTGLWTVVLALDLLRSLSGLARGIVAMSAAVTSLAHFVAVLSLLVFFVVFHRSQRLLTRSRERHGRRRGRPRRSCCRSLRARR